jgi:uncharacterized protein YuzE
LRLLGGWLMVDRLLRRSSRPLSGRLDTTARSLAHRLGISRLPGLMVCEGVVVPTLVGGLRSAILLPASAAMGVSAEMLEALIAHELCHLKRHDYLVNLWQSAVETLLFYHPAVWWVSGIIRREREFCCDDMAVDLLQDRSTYACALATMEEIRSRPLALAASDGDLLARIRRIASPGVRQGSSLSATMVALAVPAAVVIVMVAASIKVSAPATAGPRHDEASRHRTMATGALDQTQTSGLKSVLSERVVDTAAGAPESSAASRQALPAGVDPGDSVSLSGAAQARQQLPDAPVPFTLKRFMPETEITRPVQETRTRDEVPGAAAVSVPPDGSNAAPTENLDSRVQKPESSSRAPLYTGRTIGEITVAGNRVLSSAAIIALSGHKVGDPCTPEVLADMGAKLRKTGNFGMHHPDNAAAWVRIQAGDAPDNKCNVTITVDENDKVTAITIMGSAPVKPEEVRALLTPTPVFNSEQFDKDKNSIRDHYNKVGYVVALGKNAGMDPAAPGTLSVPIIVARVAEIRILKDGVRSDDMSSLRDWKTKVGDYFDMTDFDKDAHRINAPGYVVASAEWQVTHSGPLSITVKLKSMPGVPKQTAPARSRPGTERTIGEITIVGNKVMNSTGIISLSGHRIGDPCTPKVLADMQNRLARTGYFGIHYPDNKSEWVRIRGEDGPDNKCKVTITVDENDKVAAITITGSGPAKPEEIKALIAPDPVFNPAQFGRDQQNIQDFYNKMGLSVEFGAGVGMDPASPGLLVIPIMVTRVEDIVVMKDGGKTDAPRLLSQMATKAGGYFNRKTFYETDRKLLMKRYPQYDVAFTETPAGPGKVHLTIAMRHLKDGDL